jgi:hypothetical protein
MPFVAPHPEHFMHKKVGSGESIDFVKSASTASGTGTWKQGIQVIGASLGVISKGTVIATMEGDNFPTHAAAGNHAAIYLSHDPNGIRVMDQWQGQHVGERHIGFNDAGASRNNCSIFYVVE